MKTTVRSSAAASVVVTATLGVLLAAAPAQAVPIQYGGNLNYYEYFSTPLSWAAAKAAADGMTYDPDGAGPMPALDGYMVTITTGGENAFLFSNFGTEYFWLGATDAATEGTWMWDAGPETGTTFWVGGPAGTPFGYANWNPGEPNNAGAEDYAIFLAGSGFWNDETSGVVVNPDFGFVVEYQYEEPVPQVPEPASLLLLGAGMVAVVSIRRRKASKRA